MGVIITETEDSSPVEKRLWAPHLAIEMMLDTGLELRVWALHRRRALHFGTAMMWRCEPQALCLSTAVMFEMRASKFTSGHCGGAELRASNSVFSHWRDIRRVPWTSCLRREFQALCLSTEVVLWRGLQALRLGIGGMLGHRLRAPRFGVSLASEVWTTLFDDLCSVIFRQSTWSCKGNKFHDRVFHYPIHSGDCNYVHRKEVNKGKFHEPPHYLDWVSTLDRIRPPLEPPP